MEADRSSGKLEESRRRLEHPSREWERGKEWSEGREKTVGEPPKKKKKKKKKKKYIAGSSRSMMIDGSVDVGVPHPDSRDWQQVEGKGRGEAIRHISGNNSNQATFDLMPAERKRQEDNFPVKGED